MCGGTALAARIMKGGEGLSPRVRGNLNRDFQVRPVIGSIPACAGEPLFGWNIGYLLRVYPRVCGGT